LNKIFLLIAIVVSLLIKSSTSLSGYESISICLFIFFLLAFVNDIGKKLVILDVLILSALLICLLMPIVGYHFFNHNNRLARTWNFYMKVPSDEYYSYMLPALIAMIIGIKLPLFFKKQTFKFQEQYMINVKAYLANSKWQGLIMVTIGLIASVLNNYVPASLSIVFFMLRYLMFVGVFYCLYSSFPNKKLVLSIVFILLIVRSISGGMFGELVFMSVLSIILMLLGSKMKFITKLSLLVLGVFCLVVLQAVKPVLRSKTWAGKSGDNSKLAIFVEIVNDKVSNPSQILDNPVSLFALYYRFNQGQIVSRVISSVPSRFPYANGETIFLSLAATIVPRIFWTDKPGAGGVYNFERFLGVKLKGYSVGLSPFGEAYGNFGRVGGIVFMFFFGLLFNFFFNWLLSLAVKTPSLILWFPYLFFYAIQVESDVVTMVNSLTKFLLITYLCYRYFPAIFRQKI
jgi:hypothetical protein